MKKAFSYKIKAVLTGIAGLLMIFSLLLIRYHDDDRLEGAGDSCNSPVVTFYFEDGRSEYYSVNLGTIVIDAGHGGVDPGKISENGTKEKDINLLLALKLRRLFEADGYKVVLTRDKDEAVCTGKYGKVEDLTNRADIINDSEAMFTISIHQNSFPDAAVYGAQVFYDTGAGESKNLAEIIQKELNDSKLCGERSIKPNRDYFLFTHTNLPIVIVECGFLSNPSDEKKLLDEDFQNSIAKIIYNGAKKYTKKLQNG